MISSPRSGQAALEYLSTYGWAFLTMAAAIGALFYFGVFDLNQYKANECVAPPGLVCVEHAFQDAGGGSGIITANLINDYGVSITADSITASTDTGNQPYGCAINPATVDVGDPFTLTCSQDDYQQGLVQQVVVDFGFVQAGTTRVHTVPITMRASNQ